MDQKTKLANQDTMLEFCKHRLDQLEQENTKLLAALLQIHGRMPYRFHEAENCDCESHIAQKVLCEIQKDFM